MLPPAGTSRFNNCSIWGELSALLSPVDFRRAGNVRRRGKQMIRLRG